MIVRLARPTTLASGDVGLANRKLSKLQIYSFLGYLSTYVSMPFNIKVGALDIYRKLFFCEKRPNMSRNGRFLSTDRQRLLLSW